MRRNDDTTWGFLLLNQQRSIRSCINTSNYFDITEKDSSNLKSVTFSLMWVTFSSNARLCRRLKSWRSCIWHSLNSFRSIGFWRYLTMWIKWIQSKKETDILENFSCFRNNWWKAAKTNFLPKCKISYIDIFKMHILSFPMFSLCQFVLFKGILTSANAKTLYSFSCFKEELFFLQCEHLSVKTFVCNM